MSTDVAVRRFNKVLSENGWPELGPELGLMTGSSASVPESAGVYIFSAALGEELRYPRGRTRVFYIGRASGRVGLRQRLSFHCDRARACRAEALRMASEGNVDGDLFEAAYEWANAFGGIAQYAVAPPGSDARPVTDMEATLHKAFEYDFYTLPLANRRSENVRGDDPKGLPVE